MLSNKTEQVNEKPKLSEQLKNEFYFGGKPGKFVWTDTWLKRDGKWQIVAAEDLMPVPSPFGQAQHQLIATTRMCPAMIDEAVNQRLLSAERATWARDIYRAGNLAIHGARSVGSTKNRVPAALDKMTEDVFLKTRAVVEELHSTPPTHWHLVNSLAELESLGVAFISLTDNLDLTTPAGRLMLHIISAMSEFEKSLIVERTKAGLRHARGKGKRLGRGRGQPWTPKGSPLSAQPGCPAAAISRQMGVPRSSLHLALAGRSQNVPGKCLTSNTPLRQKSPAANRTKSGQGQNCIRPGRLRGR